MPDFFAWSKVIPSLLYPLPLTLLVLFALSWAVPRFVPRWTVRVFVAILWTASTPWAADQLAAWWEVPRSTASALPASSDAAIVLGGLSNPGISTPEHLEFNRAAERITEAVDLWRAGRVKNLLITSGSGELFTQPPEAPGLAAWAERQGVPAKNVAVEDRSRNTKENAEFSLPIAHTQGWKSFVLITSAAHMRRSEAIFRKAGYGSDGKTMVVWPVDTLRDDRPFPMNAMPDPASLLAVHSILKEVTGYAAYWLMGYL
jgi:uncharacterized SAM-binding protein YcdF (DUF218 family)